MRVSSLACRRVAGGAGGVAFVAGGVARIASGSFGELIGRRRARRPKAWRRIRLGRCKAATAHIAECDRAADRSITRAHGIAVVAGFDEPLAAAVRAAADHADMMGPHDDRADLRPAGAGALPGPVAGQIETRVGDAEDMAHVGAAPRPAMTVTMAMAVRQRRYALIMM